MRTVEQLTTRTVVDYLRDRHLLDPGPVQVEEITGGVSCVVLGVTTAGQSWVVKQALPRLRVGHDWYAGQERTLTEAHALALVSGWTPEQVPAVIAVDPDHFVLVIDRAPAVMTPWKSRLLDGDCDPGVAATLGGVLGRWHRLSHGDQQILAGLGSPQAFAELRLDPYYRSAAAALPAAAERIGHLVNLMAGRRLCLVHGDFSPKNVLTGAGRVWVLDFEVAHAGDPDFDVAFLLTHLIAKAFHHPESRPDLARCAAAFVAAYEDELRGSPLIDLPSTATAHVGALLLARVHGKSPLEYLGDRARQRVTAAGLGALAAPFAPRSQAWTLATQAGDAR